MPHSFIHSCCPDWQHYVLSTALGCRSAQEMQCMGVCTV